MFDHRFHPRLNRSFLLFLSSFHTDVSIDEENDKKFCLNLSLALFELLLELFDLLSKIVDVILDELERGRRCFLSASVRLSITREKLFQTTKILLEEVHLNLIFF